MEGLEIYNEGVCSPLVSKRPGEVKIGQRVQYVSKLDGLLESNARFVLLGIPEDIGVRANQGTGGAGTVWEPALKAFLNIQSTPFFHGDDVLVLGHFNFQEPVDADIAQLQQKVADIDGQVYVVIQQIIAAGKTPIVIGGGHNNAYPIIKGISLALKRPIDVINIDAHADLRPAEGRHSGNGFSYALKDAFLNRYGIFGLQENYNNATILETITTNPHIYPVFFEELLKNKVTIGAAWTGLLQKTGATTGLELDLDSIENVLSSASGPSGFRLNEIRTLILTSKKRFAYLHVCEGAVALSDGRHDHGTAKTIAYLISDFIKSQTLI